MKQLLLTAAAIGAVLAAMIIYNERKNRPENRIKDAAEDAYDTMNEGIGSIERPMHNAMG
jgi:hypothetical protein